MANDIQQRFGHYVNPVEWAREIGPHLTLQNVANVGRFLVILVMAVVSGAAALLPKLWALLNRQDNTKITCRVKIKKDILFQNDPRERLPDPAAHAAAAGVRGGREQDLRRPLPPRGHDVEGRQAAGGARAAEARPAIARLRRQPVPEEGLCLRGLDQQLFLGRAQLPQEEGEYSETALLPKPVNEIM